MEFITGLIFPSLQQRSAKLTVHSIENDIAAEHLEDRTLKVAAVSARKPQKGPISATKSASEPQKDGPSPTKQPSKCTDNEHLEVWVHEQFFEVGFTNEHFSFIGFKRLLGLLQTKRPHEATNISATLKK